MSSHIVEDQVINNIVTAMKHRNKDNDFPNVAYIEGFNSKPPAYFGKRLAQELFEMNFKAVDYRYGKNTDLSKTKFPYSYSSGSRIAIYWNLAEFIYQCSEGEEVPNSPLFKAVEQYYNKLAHKIAMDTPAPSGWGSSH